jgi:nucleoside 2-deoxyribosyltransferase
MKIFLAGIIQGSELGTSIHDQGYRQRIRAVLEEAFPEAVVYSPQEEHPDSVMYPDNKGQQVFFEIMERAKRADLVIAYLPEASMGTAIEMWIAFRAGKTVVAITPMESNWCVKYLSHHVCPNLADFEHFVRSGELRSLLEGSGDTLQ